MPSDLNTDAPPLRSHGLAHDLVSELTQRILLGKLSPGDKLPSENTLVREHRISRTVVREAISKLQASGLVETRRGIGSFVLERSQQERPWFALGTATSIRHILDFRLGVESQAAAMAACNRNDQQLTSMRKALDDYQDLAALGNSCSEADRRFHMLIAEATGNPYFTEVMSYLGNAIIPRNRLSSSQHAGNTLARHAYLANLEHEAILNAIRRQDAEAARSAVWLHLSNSRDRLLPSGLLDKPLS